MKSDQREVRVEADTQAMIALAQGRPPDNLHVVDLPYRLSSWALDDPANIGLWVDATGRMMAWAVMQTPFWTVDYVLHPAADAHLHRQVLAWADNRACLVLETPSGRPCWFVMAFANQTDRIRGLEEAGFTSQARVGEDSWSKVLLQRPAQGPLAECASPTDFLIRPLAGAEEIQAYVELHRTAFGRKNMTTEWRARTLCRPEYLPDLDLVAVAPDGRLAAFCIGWLSRSPAGSHRGQIEPLGVHPRFRGLGLGRAILSEGLRRLYSRGADSVYVETDLYRNAALELYETVGFRPVQEVLVYRKDYGGTHS